jgi:NAD(P)-dependent dehydrogenase (short-subunit alcohol dehydrogenase family)
MIYNILIVGGGSKLGLELTKNYLIQGHNVDVITGSDLSEYQKEYKNLKVVEVDWGLIEYAPQTIENKINKLSTTHYDIVIFNQNNLTKHTSFLLEQKHQHTSFINNVNTNVLLGDIILRFLYHYKITENTKVVYNISRIITCWNNERELSLHGDKAGYAAIKTLNYLFIKGYSKFNKGIYFCIEPGHFNKDIPGSIEQAGRDIVTFIAKADPSFNGLAFQSYNGQEEYNIINYED